MYAGEKKFADLFSKLLGKGQYPLYETCSFCGVRDYLPFHCEYCGQYFCERHRLPFDHDCKNIDAWMKQPVRPRKSKEK